ncbi:hypothetical protein D5086_033365 [Populus alba]|uniref:Uncharacterized protein n=1 Tax=Populus alba TaxID=43335 RepID=A0ACC4AGM4_POPAL
MHEDKGPRGAGVACDANMVGTYGDDGGWQGGHATFYGGGDASGTMGVLVGMAICTVKDEMCSDPKWCASLGPSPSPPLTSSATLNSALSNDNGGWCNPPSNTSTWLSQLSWQIAQIQRWNCTNLIQKGWLSYDLWALRRFHSQCRIKGSKTGWQANVETGQKWRKQFLPHMAKMSFFPRKEEEERTAFSDRVLKVYIQFPYCYGTKSCSGEKKKGKSTVAIREAQCTKVKQRTLPQIAYNSPGNFLQSTVKWISAHDDKREV